MKKIFIFCLMLFLSVNSYAGTISRQGGNFETHDELADLSQLNNQLETVYSEVNGNLDYANIENEGIQNADFDSDEAFSRENWNNTLRSGHFPTWSSGASSCPDDWCLELTPTIARDTAATGAPYSASFSPDFYSVKLTASGVGYEGINQSFNCRASTEHSVMLKVKCTSGDVARISISDDGGMDTVTYDYSDTSWQTENNKKYFTFKTASDSSFVTVKLMAKEDGDIVWFSEVQVTEGRLMKGYQYQSANADTVDDIHASTTAQANKLLALNANSKLPASITGDADTVDDIHASTTAVANKLLALNADSKLPASITGDADTVDSIHASTTAVASKLLALDASSRLIGSGLLDIQRGVNQTITGGTNTTGSDPTLVLDDPINITTNQTCTLFAWMIVRHQSNGVNTNYFKIRYNAVDFSPIEAAPCAVQDTEYKTIMLRVATGVAAGALTIQAYHTVSGGTSLVNSGQLFIIAIPE